MQRIGVGLRIDRNHPQAEALRVTRTAIAPRLAIRTEVNMLQP